MGVLATFDAKANWAQTHVCDSLLLESLKPLGAAWGRCSAQGPWPAEGSLTALLEARHKELAPLHARFGTDSVDRIRLTPEAFDWPERRSEWRPPRVRAGRVYCVLEGTLLVYLQAEGGHVGVLCEAGEWLAIPAGTPYALDAGEAPDLDVLVLSAPSGHPGAQNQLQADPGLPSLDAFVETMLELTGHAADE
ncbi:hypothetical protein [Variovorax fucosicus]|uniref:hypothetical protein n=1 Tax=Variovorax fucosicus TaxID=3053517 RepID=UPI002576DCA3|nr:hypothetical protein [Variovorax sp. J22G47]MDM0059072.1 hypothetical protein [Variovorax sp. J22G47]